MTDNPTQTKLPPQATGGRRLPEKRNAFSPYRHQQIDKKPNGSPAVRFGACEQVKSQASDDLSDTYFL